MYKLTTLAFLLFSFFILTAQDAVIYQNPPKQIMSLVMAKQQPSVSISDNANWIVYLERNEMPTVEDLAQPELRIAGMRINPNNYGPSRANYFVGITIKNLKTGNAVALTGLPLNLKISDLNWSPNEDKIAFLNTTNNQIDLYVVNLLSAKVQRINKMPVNQVLGGVDWFDNNTIYYLAATQQAKNASAKPLAPKGPVVQQNLGKTAASVTYQDLIKTPYDEQLFEFYSTSQLTKNVNGVETKIGAPAIYASFDFSPDNKFILVEKIDKPFSYLVTVSGFNSSVYVTDVNGKLIKQIAKLPSSELAPTGYDNVLNAPRAHSWVNTLPSTLKWIEPQDSGLIKNTVLFHDAVYFQNIATNEVPKIVAQSKMRMANFTPITESVYLMNEISRVKQTIKTTKYNIANGDTVTLFNRSTNDAYNDPGSPVTAKNKFGKNSIKLLNSNTLLMRGNGASPNGDLPFLRSYNVDTKQDKEIWRCATGFYENVVSITDFENLAFITLKQSPTEMPNYFLYKNGISSKITDFKDPQPELRGISKEKINYKRSDGVDLTGELYLPNGYNKDRDGRLPIIMWAYPREFKSNSDAAQVRGTKYNFVRVNYGSPVFWATQGYAVLDNAEFPIVGEGEKAPNDNFVAQLIMNAKAAIDKVYELGVGDSTRVAVGGHSYGAFMTVNLLAHSKLFKAGIARSGAYNRSLTPFGFQNEERTYWQAPQLYYEMSPFAHANKIKTPLLLIHGEADNNPGTFPIQSERLFNAVKGHGGTIRYVQLPFESHGYAAKENILHLLWEQHQWLEKYVKAK
jgi:dipeptidyl aminopeptidase/acylaminoacyl peptidase